MWIDLCKTLLPPIATGLLAYFGAVHKSKAKINEIKEEYENQAKLYEKNKQTDLTAEMFKQVSKNKQFMTILMKELNKNFK